MEHAEEFAAFYGRCRPDLHAAVLATVSDPQLARDAVDEAFVRAAERWPQVRGLDRPAGWVYRVAVNWAISWRRKWSLRPTRPTDTLDSTHHDVVPDVDLVRQLATLPLSQRQMLVLRYALGYSVRETAAVLGVAAGTVKSGVHRARRQLGDDAEVRDGRP